MIPFGSLFSGIGGLDLGLERAGFACKWQVENNKYARKVLCKHWPNIHRYKNAQKVNWKDASLRVPVLAGGFPCQPVSNTGRKKAQKDSRWLWPCFQKAISEIRPKIVIMENVPGIFARGRGFEEVLGDLARMGYDAEWGCFPAVSFGAPHERKRMFLVAYPTSIYAQTRIFTKSRAEKIPFTSPCWGADKPGVDRASNGTPHRVDRLVALGNAVVPQVAEWIGKIVFYWWEEVAQKNKVAQ